MLLTLFGLFCNFILSSAEMEPNDGVYCFYEDAEPDLLFGSATNYEVAKSKFFNPKPEGCEIKAMWMLIRHGTSYPSAEEFKTWEKMLEMRDAIVHNHKNNNGDLCEKDVAGLEAWYPVLDPTKQNLLSKVGYAEAAKLGKDLTEAFPEVFRNLSIPATVMFSHSDQKRTKDTAQTFVDAMKNAGCSSKITNLRENPILSLDQSCPKWETISKRDDLYKEVKLYKLVVDVSEMLHEVSHKLGFSFDLKYDVVYCMYKLCTYETVTAFENLSPWCAVFEKHHFKIFRNDEDLLSYYSSGYGNPMAAKLGCPAAQHLFHCLGEVAKSPSDDPKIYLLFGQELNLRSLLTTLGIAWDADPLDAKNIRSLPTRMWNTSQISPFLGNLMVTLYRCENRFKVKFLLNNYVVQYSGCNTSLCDWSYVENEFDEVIDPMTCNFEFCGKEQSKSSLLLSNLFLNVIIIVTNIYL